MAQTYEPIGETPAWQRALPYVLLAGGLAGMAASFALTYDKLQSLADPSYDPSCNLNPVFSCVSVMSSPQADILGVPNPVFGLVAFSMLTMFALTLLAGANYQRWLWLGAQAMATAGIIFMHYLFFQSVFRIHAICPWCFAVWMVTIPIFLGITLHNIRAGHFGFGRRGPAKRLLRFIGSHSADLLVCWYLILFSILAYKFWYYWQTLF